MCMLTACALPAVPHLHHHAFCFCQTAHLPATGACSSSPSSFFSSIATTWGIEGGRRHSLHIVAADTRTTAARPHAMTSSTAWGGSTQATGGRHMMAVDGSMGHPGLSRTGSGNFWSIAVRRWCCGKPLFVIRRSKGCLVSGESAMTGTRGAAQGGCAADGSVL